MRFFTPLLELLISLKDYLYEKAGKSRHNKTVGYLIIILGSTFLSANS